MSCAGYLAEHYQDKLRRLRDEKERLEKHLETLRKLRLIDLKLEDIEKEK